MGPVVGFGPNSDDLGRGILKSDLSRPILQNPTS